MPFASTRWSLVVKAGGDSPDAAAALAELCEGYWYPVYAFVRRSGYSSADAQDLTQGFFTRVLERRYLRAANPERGSFRAFLIGALRHYLANERDWVRALKRGGAFVHVPIDLDAAEPRYAREPAERETPETTYARQWAMAVLAQAMARLDADYTGRRQDMYRRLNPLLAAAPAGVYGTLAPELGMTEGALRVAVHRLRREYGAMLRKVIAETVVDTADVESELRYLLKVLRTETKAGRAEP